jgi:hypothetical protein
MARVLDVVAVWTLVVLAFLLVVLCVIGWLYILIKFPLFFGVVSLGCLGYWALYRVATRELDAPWVKE